MNLTPKEQAEQNRKIADAYIALADAFGPLHRPTAKSFRVAAESYREKADNLDQQPQPEWQDGDYSRDRFGGLWQFDGSKWYRRCMERSTASLNRDYGPIHKVHIADPAKHEVAVSLDGIDRGALDQMAGEFFKGSIGHVVAQAAREQLGEVQ